MGAPRSALVVGDPTEVDWAIERLLAAGQDVEHVPTAELAALSRALDDHVVQVLLVGAATGPEIGDVVRLAGERGLPLVVIAGAIDERAAVAAVRSGAADFVSCPEQRALVSVVHRALASAPASGQARDGHRQARLAQADRLANLGTIAAGVAHEINNPLTYVAYNLDALTRELPRVSDRLRAHNLALRAELGEARLAAVPGIEGAADVTAHVDELRSWAEEAAQGVRRVQQIVRDLRTFSNVKDDRLALVSVNRVIEGALNIALNEIKFRARVVKDLGPLPPVLANDGKLAQVFLNLLINAAQAIDEGDVEGNQIRITTRVAGQQARISISDTGSGIAPEHLGRLFDPFFTTKQAGVGSGLGLAICRDIVKGYRGEIEVESTPGRGTRFVLSLPLPDATQERAASAQFPAVSATDEPRARVLVIDDEPYIGRAVRRLLEDQGHEVVIASGGQEGRRTLDVDDRFDVIICDLMMPGVSGMQLHEWLVERRADLARRLVFMTGGAFTPKTKAFLARVANVQLDKPVDSRDLLALVRRMARGNAP